MIASNLFYDFDRTYLNPQDGFSTSRYQRSKTYLPTAVIQALRSHSTALQREFAAREKVQIVRFATNVLYACERAQGAYKSRWRSRISAIASLVSLCLITRIPGAMAHATRAWRAGGPAGWQPYLVFGVLMATIVSLALCKPIRLMCRATYRWGAPTQDELNQRLFAVVNPALQAKGQEVTLEDIQSWRRELVSLAGCPSWHRALYRKFYEKRREYRSLGYHVVPVFLEEHNRIELELLHEIAVKRFPERSFRDFEFAPFDGVSGERVQVWTHSNGLDAVSALDELAKDYILPRDLQSYVRKTLLEKRRTYSWGSQIYAVCVPNGRISHLDPEQPSIGGVARFLTLNYLSPECGVKVFRCSSDRMKDFLTDLADEILKRAEPKSKSLEELLSDTERSQRALIRNLGSDVPPRPLEAQCQEVIQALS